MRIFSRLDTHPDSILSLFILPSIPKASPPRYLPPRLSYRIRYASVDFSMNRKWRFVRRLRSNIGEIMQRIGGQPLSIARRVGLNARRDAYALRQRLVPGGRWRGRGFGIAGKPLSFDTWFPHGSGHKSVISIPK